MGGKLSCILFCVLILSCSSQAITLKSYQAAFDMREATFVELYYEFSSIDQNQLAIPLPADASNITVLIDNKPSNFTLNSSDAIFLNLGRETVTARIRFTSSQYSASNSTFMALVRTPFNTSSQVINLTLPEQAILRTGLGSEGSASIAPQPTRVDFPNSRLRFSWEKKDAAEGERINILAQYYLPQIPEVSRTQATEPYPSSMMLILLPFASTIITLIIVGALAFLVLRKFGSFGEVEEVLMDDEAQIVRVLKSKGGACEQGTLCVITGFSKAKLSQLLSELELRKVIYKKKKGNKNIIILKDSVQRVLSSMKFQE